MIYNLTLSDWFKVVCGVRQGCILSPMLFLVAVDWVMRKTTSNCRLGIQWSIFSQLDDLDYADDLEPPEKWDKKYEILWPLKSVYSSKYSIFALNSLEMSKYIMQLVCRQVFITFCSKIQFILTLEID